MTDWSEKSAGTDNEQLRPETDPEAVTLGAYVQEVR